MRNGCVQRRIEFIKKTKNLDLAQELGPMVLLPSSETPWGFSHSSLKHNSSEPRDLGSPSIKAAHGGLPPLQVRAAASTETCRRVSRSMASPVTPLAAGAITGHGTRLSPPSHLRAQEGSALAFCDASSLSPTRRVAAGAYAGRANVLHGGPTSCPLFLARTRP
ncbi:hypothetical protein VIGAN_06259900 [Vigna angularis var. angularis]|uniref:Uncharacterized protein n=1 Tax=Vigna angularis var. angularis TaxID=157739 RepID=A0A0S3SEL9_PHAAN|nr:hypothetical protein VIGAN_06259900 [Vigna angularis var. angularis]